MPDGQDEGANGVAMASSPSDSDPKAIETKAGPSRKRKRKTHSCASCNKRKVKCDLQRPTCANCIRRGDFCEWTEPVLFPSGSLSEEIGTLEARLSYLKERQVPPLPSPSDASPSPSASLSQVPRLGLPPQALPSRLAPPSPSRPPPPPSYMDSRSAPFEAPPEASSTRQEMYSQESYDHHILKPEAAALSRQPSSEVDELNGSVSARRDSYREDMEPRMFVAFPFNTGAAESISRNQLLQAVIDSIPSQVETDSLLADYFVNVEWMHHPIDVSAFWSAYVAFWKRPPERRGLLTPPKWLALFTMMLSLSFHFCRNDVVREEMLYQSSQVALSLSNFLFEHSLEAIATIILMGLRLNNRNASHCHQILLALAIRMAQSMGLHRLATESEGTRHRHTHSVEYARRLWYQLVYQDSYNASGCGFSYNIVDSQNKTSLPLNIYDSELSFQNVQPRPRTEMTEQSYHNEKMAFASLARRYVEIVTADADPPYSEILELDQAYRRIYESLPPLLNPDLAHLHPAPPYAQQQSPARVFERIFMGFTYHNRLMRLHRTYIAKGYKDPRFRWSTDVALGSAKSCLSLAKQGQATNFPGLKWWVVLLHVFTAGICVVINLFHIEGSLDDPGTRVQVLEQRALVRFAIDVLQSATNVSHVAARAVQILERMLEREADRRSSVPTTLAPTSDARETSAVSEDLNIFDGSAPLDWTSILNAMSSATTKGALAPDGTDANSAFWHGIANTDLDDLFVAGGVGVDGGQSWTFAL